MSIRDITIGRYVFGESLIHRLDPRTKLLSLVIVTAALFSRDGWHSMALVSAYAVSACMLSGLKPGYLIRSIMPFKWLIVMTVLLNVLFKGGHILFEAPLPYGGVTSEGLEAGLINGGRIALLVLMASLMTLTTEPIVLVDGIEKLIGPLSHFGIRPHEVSLAMVITIRFIPILIDEAGKIRKSHIARGMSRDGGLVSKLSATSMMFLPLFHSALRRAEILAVAMECRLYDSGNVRTRYVETVMESRDWRALSTAVVVAVIALAI